MHPMMMEAEVKHRHEGLLRDARKGPFYVGRIVRGVVVWVALRVAARD